MKIVNRYDKEGFTEEEKEIIAYFSELAFFSDDLPIVKARYMDEEEIREWFKAAEKANGDTITPIALYEQKFDAASSILILVVRLW